jgi:hypothetical protein
MPARHVTGPGRRRDAGPRGPIHWFVRGSGAVLKLSILVLGISGAYIVYGILGGHLTPEGGGAARVESIFQSCSTGFTVAAILLATCLFVRYYDNPLLVYLGALPGVAAFFVVPFLVGTRNAEGSTIAQHLVQSMRLCGEAVFMIVALRAGIAVWDRIRRPPAAEKPAARVGKPEPRKKAGVKPPLWAKCWDLSYCHETLREVCPAYKQRKNCWRIKKGCNCDEAMIERLVQARAVAKGVSQQKQRTAEEYMREELREPGRLRTGKQLISCSQCPIYAEHQRQKFLILNPIVIVALFVGFYFAAPVYTSGFKATLIQLDKFCEKFAFRPDAEPSVQRGGQDYGGREDDEYYWRTARERYKDVGEAIVERRQLVTEEKDGYRMTSWLGRELNDDTVHWIIYVVLCIFLLTQALHVVEWAVFTMHW